CPYGPPAPAPNPPPNPPGGGPKPEPEVPLRPRPSLQAVRRSESRTVDLTAEDDTQAMPRYAFDSLEAKLSEMERKLG
ncbi:hypothetical protein ACFCZ6_30185, partial [Streptomyces hydrogenans]